MEDPQARVKHEPPVEFVLILPRPTIGWPAIKQEDKLKWWVKSVNVTKFDAKWRVESKLFRTFFTCQHCQILVKAQGHLAQHLNACSKINPERFECDICEGRLNRKDKIRRHMLKHSIEGNFHCPKCGFGFKRKEGLLNHLRSKMVYKCAACDVKFSCKLLMDRHQSEFHGNGFKCDKCPYETKRKGDFMQHKGTHDKPFACETCQRNFSTSRKLKSHQIQRWHGIYATAPGETFDCEKCDKSFSRSDSLKQHENQVHDDNEVKCEVCDKICKNQRSLFFHSRSHVKVECSCCKKKVSKWKITLHMQIHSGNIFECDLCKYSARCKNSLKRHVERMHLLRKLMNDSKCREDFCEFEQLEELQLKHGSSATTSEKKFKCVKCSKAFVTRRTLNRHKKDIHVNNLLECKICKKKLSQDHLKAHMKLHSPGNHFECDLCDCKFKTKQYLESHIKGRHRNGASICPFGCRDKFASFDRLIEHRKIHVEKKLWKCEKCEYQTANRSKLSRHMATKKHKI